MLKDSLFESDMWEEATYLNLWYEMVDLIDVDADAEAETPSDGQAASG
jgi:hypothetical protein